MRILKWIGITLGVIVLLVCAGVGSVYAWAGSQLTKTVADPAHGFKAPTDSASVARGEHVVRAIAKCADCHGADFGGDTLINDPMMGFIWAPNLTTGKGGVLANYDDAHLEGAIRHGVRHNGQRLMVMPSNEYQLLSDEDLGTIVAYLRAQPPVDREPPGNVIKLLPRMLYAAGIFPLFPHEKVTHTTEVVAAVPVDTTVEYGRYLADGGCAGCHGQGYGGGAIPGGPPDWPKPANLTPTGIGHYSQQDFINAMRTGMRPSGVAINEFMPINATKLMTDTEIVAIYKYLKTVPPKEFGTR